MAENSTQWYSIVEPVRASLAGLIDYVQADRDRWGGEPSADAPALSELVQDAEWSGLWGDDPVTEALDLAGLQLYASADHLLALCRLIAIPTPVVFGHATLARSGMECAGRAAWLAAPGIGASERVRRYMVEHLYSIDQLLRLDPGGHMDTMGRRDRLLRQREDLLTEAERRGLRRRARKGRPAGLTGPDRPGATKAVRDLFAGGRSDAGPDVSYGVFSAASHGTEFGLLRVLDPSTGDWAPNARRGRAKVLVNADDVNLVLGTAQSAFTIAAHTHRALMGWNDASWPKVVANTSAIVRPALDQADRRLGRAGAHERVVYERESGG